MIPRPRISIWWPITLFAPCPMSMEPFTQRISTTSSATRRCPRSISSRAVSLFPTPESPVRRMPMPKHLDQNAVDGCLWGEDVGEYADHAARELARIEARAQHRAARGFGCVQKAVRGKKGTREYAAGDCVGKKRYDGFLRVFGIQLQEIGRFAAAEYLEPVPGE